LENHIKAAIAFAAASVEEYLPFLQPRRFDEDQTRWNLPLQIKTGLTAFGHDVHTTYEENLLQKGKFKCKLPKALEARRANAENVEFPDRLDQRGHRVKPAKRVSMDSGAREAELAPAGWQEP
jgi:hypothetical protein